MKDWLLATAMMLLTTTVVCVAQGRGDVLLPMREHGKWGFIDAVGRIRISARFDDAFWINNAFDGDLEPVKKNGRWGFITPDGNFGDSQYPGANLNPCFDHQTLADLLEAHGLTWKYYTATPNGIWTAPNAIRHICLQSGTPPPATCNNTDYTNNVLHPNKFFLDFPSGGASLVNGPTCTLPNVSWIIPDGLNSDHPGFKNQTQVHSIDIEGGPNWVASIVNAVGNANCKEPDGTSPWLDTVILVVWDDWGGWYDHVLAGYEDNFLQLGSGNHCKPKYNNLFWGCGYTYGFRVPFLVVSAYTGDGTVSGACGTPTTPPCGVLSNVAPHQNDFGSILAFIEYNFGLTLGGINLANGFPFADYWAPELQAPAPGPYPPLGDFFNLTQAKKFEPITTVNNSFTFNYFYNFNGPYTDPDNDVIDND